MLWRGRGRGDGSGGIGGELHGSIGGGVIGLELGSVWRRLGSEVTVVEYLDHIMPGMDAEVQKQALRIFKKQKMKFELGRKVTGVEKSGKTLTVKTEASAGGKEEPQHEKRGERNESEKIQYSKRRLDAIGR